MGNNPFTPKPDSTSGALSPEDQAEYDRLEALEKDRAAGADRPGNLPEFEQTKAGDVQVDDRDRDVPAEDRYPIQNGAVKWDDAANGGDTSRQAELVYDTPWGRRALSAEEASDFHHQGVPIRCVDEQPLTSIQDEQDEMSKVGLDFKPQN